MKYWKVGDVRVTAIDEMVISFDCEQFFPTATQRELAAIPWLGEPFVTAEGLIRLVVRAFVIETPKTRIIVDTCMGNDKPRRWTAANMLNTGFLGRLSSAGYPRDSIDVVLCTHLHVDHVGWNTMRAGERWVPTFPNARYLFARTEFTHWEAKREGDDGVIFADSVQPIVDAGLDQLVETDHRVDSWVNLVPTPGHTPGHVSVAIESGGEKALITGDSFHSPAQIARPDWSSIPDHDRAMSAETRRQILREMAGTSARMLGTHFPEPTAGRIVRDGDGYRFDPLPGGAE